MKLRDIDNTAVRTAYARMQSPHQARVNAFMHGAKQLVPESPTMPDEDVRKLRARLIFEEAMETINALGVGVFVPAPGHGLPVALNSPGNPSGVTEVQFSTAGYVCDLVEVADGCADIAVVTTGTLSACGIQDTLLQEEVDNNNLAKFAPGHYIDEGGKLIKPPNHTPPDIAAILLAQSGDQFIF